MLSGINTTATRALGKYVANHPVGTYIVLAVAGVLAWRYWHKLRRVVVRERWWLRSCMSRHLAPVLSAAPRSSSGYAR